MNKMMFPFITKTWNPLAGACSHACKYCYTKDIKKLYPATKAKYQGEPRLVETALNKVFGPKEFVFVCDMTDLFAENVSSDIIQRILDRISLSRATYLLLTKNPMRYSNFKIPENCVAGATIETDLNSNLANAPDRNMRLHAMIDLKHPRKMVSVEPIMMFSAVLPLALLQADLEFVAVGYDNHGAELSEPSEELTIALIEILEGDGIKVYRKSIRKAIWEASQ